MVQLFTPHTDVERHCAQRYRQTDRRTYRLQWQTYTDAECPWYTAVHRQR